MDDPLMHAYDDQYDRPLTEEEILEIAANGMMNVAGGIYATSVIEFARAIETAHGVTANVS